MRAGKQNARRKAEAQKLSNSDIDPSLHFDKLAQSEDVEYRRGQKHLFRRVGACSSQHRSRAHATAQRPRGRARTAQAARHRSEILRLLPNKDKVLKAFFVHGDDIFMASTGEIVDHRYKVGAIRPLSVEVTDLAYNNTQTLTLSAF